MLWVIDLQLLMTGPVPPPWDFPLNDSVLKQTWAKPPSFGSLEFHTHKCFTKSNALDPCLRLKFAQGLDFNSCPVAWVRFDTSEPRKYLCQRISNPFNIGLLVRIAPRKMHQVIFTSNDVNSLKCNLSRLGGSMCELWADMTTLLNICYLAISSWYGAPNHSYKLQIPKSVWCKSSKTSCCCTMRKCIRML